MAVDEGEFFPIEIREGAVHGTGDPDLLKALERPDATVQVRGAAAAATTAPDVPSLGSGGQDGPHGTDPQSGRDAPSD
jgi:hypothetical protein